MGGWVRVITQNLSITAKGHNVLHVTYTNASNVRFALDLPMAIPVELWHLKVSVALDPVENTTDSRV